MSLLAYQTFLVNVSLYFISVWEFIFVCMCFLLLLFLCVCVRVYFVFMCCLNLYLGQ